MNPHCAGRSKARVVAVAALVACVLAAAACGERSRNEDERDVAARWELVEELVIAAADTGPTGFGDIHSIVATPNGNIFVLDSKDKTIRVFDSEGQFLRLAARHGKGPGEIEYPTGMAVGPTEVFVHDPALARYVVFDFNGKYQRQVAAKAAGYGDIWRGAVDSLGNIIDFPVRYALGGVDPRTRYPLTEDRLRIIHASGQADTIGGITCGKPMATHVYRAHQGHITSLGIPNSPVPVVVVTGAGKTWCTPSNEYRLLVASFGDSLQTVVYRSVKGEAIPAGEWSRMRDAHMSWANERIGTLVDDGGEDFPRTYPVITALYADNIGRAWVQRGGPSHTNSLDVYDLDGTHVATVQIPTALGRSLFITERYVYAIQRDADDVPNVVRYGIARR